MKTEFCTQHTQQFEVIQAARHQLLSVVTVNLETMRIVRVLPRLDFR